MNVDEIRRVGPKFQDICVGTNMDISLVYNDHNIHKENFVKIYKN